MNQGPIEHLIIPDNRQRRKFNERKMEELMASIQSKGLMHPIVIRKESNDIDDVVEHYLVAGERRLKAIVELHKKKVKIKCDGQVVRKDFFPFIRMEDLTALQIREAELEENVVREDLTVQEKAKAYADLHKLRVEQHGDYDPSTKEGWSKTDTASEISGGDAAKYDISKISKSLLIAEHLDDPEVAAARNETEALKAIKETKKAQKRKQLADKFDATMSPHSCILGDCFDIALPDEYNIIIADPPYGIDIHKDTTFDGQKHDYDDSDAYFTDIILQLLPKYCKQMTPEQAHIYIFCDIRRWRELFVAFELAGFEVWRRPLIWDKGSIGSYGGMDYGFRQTYEAILFANKGRRKMVKPGGEVFSIHQPSSLPHPAGKPVELYKEILSRSIYPGDRILDPFCGSGPVFGAASALMCVATGIEINDKYYHMSLEAIQNELG